MMLQGWCVIGAGPSGLATSRALARLGIEHVVYEKHDDVGGIWDMANEGTPLYESAHFISSKWTSGFTGFPMSESLADYPHHSEVLRYLREFADAYDLRRHVRFNTLVKRAEPEAGGWRVHLADGSSVLHRGVICANGVTWLPSMPQWPGHFDGDLRHSVTYSGPSEFDGKRVLIVGLGNSGADIACDAARHAEHAGLSVRRGYHFLPKHVYGWPIDVHFRRSELLPPEIKAMNLRSGVFAITGDVTRLGIPKPDHDFGQAHPLLNTQLLHHLAHGDIEVQPDIERLDGHTVHFVDGSTMQADLILAATGYQVTAPYLHDSLFETRGQRVMQYLNVFSRRHGELFTIGFAEVAAGIYPLIDQMAHLLAHHLHDRDHRPDAALAFEKFKTTDNFDVRGGKHFVASDRHANYIDLASYTAYVDEICWRFGWPLLADVDHRSQRSVSV
jgi:cation diffusion facilitator CzcD-associated flavoprotein CzcO